VPIPCWFVHGRRDLIGAVRDIDTCSGDHFDGTRCSLESPGSPPPNLAGVPGRIARTAIYASKPS
jgi:hypothetical protein